ncbi:leader peptidase (prepilin peptidase)/N-methyltransferase [Brevundimonas vesicularis]|nr:leader peptidase (prepilin peptidase)/N-methyltransferase [Brevundimonas vesicularis]
MNPVLAAAVMGGLGLLVGRLVAVVSVRLRGEDSRAAPRWRDPLIVRGGGLLGVWAGLCGQTWLMMAATAILGWQLLLIAVVDGENLWLPDILTWPLIATGLGVAAVMDSSVAFSHLIGAAIGFGGLWALGRVYRIVRKRDGLGGGDPFLLAGAGAWVGWMGLPSVLLWACAVSLSLVFFILMIRRAVSGSEKLPFGVFLAIGIWMTWLYGPLGL